MGKGTERIITSALKAFVVLAAICSAQRGGCPCNKENESPWWRSSSAKWRLLCFDTDRPTGCPLSPEESSTYLRERVPQEGKGSESTHLRQVEIHVFFRRANRSRIVALCPTGRAANSLDPRVSRRKPKT